MVLNAEEPAPEEDNMPSIDHETPIELIRHSPLLAVDVVRRFTGLAVEGAVDVELAPTDLSVVVPSQFLADSVAVIKNARGTPLLAVVIEPQGRSAITKQYSWPVYVCATRKAHQCDAVLMVVCWDKDEAGECGKTISTGHPGFELTPFVSAPGSPLRQGESVFEPLSGPYWTLYEGYMRYIDMDTDQGQEAILQAARQVPEPNRKSCITLMLAAASEAARRAMEAKMATVAYRNEFIESFVDQGVARGLADAILEVLRVRGIEVTVPDIERVSACSDLEQLHAWHRAAVTASTADEVFRS